MSDHTIIEPWHGGCVIRDATEPRVILATISLQEGPVKEHGVNGVFVEDLLEISVARLKSYQAGPFPDGRTAKAIELMSELFKN
jgi:hypothetical protein